jgi:dihydrofolate reductase
MMSMIVAHDPNRVIGFQNNIPWHLPEDLALFKRMTMGHPVIMGRKTYESILESLGKPLPERHHIVISRSILDVPEGVEVVRSVVDVIARFIGSEEHAFVIGGAKIYEQFLPFIDTLYVSRLKRKYSGDTFFPYYDNEHEYQEQDRVEYDDFSFITYKRFFV